MYIILELKNGGKFRRKLEDVFRRNNWWVHSIHPKTFKRSFERIMPPPYEDGLNPEYEYVVGEFLEMENNLKEDRNGFCLIVVDISKPAMEMLKEDFGAFEYKDFINSTPERVFEILTGKEE